MALGIYSVVGRWHIQLKVVLHTGSEKNLTMFAIKLRLAGPPQTLRQSREETWKDVSRPWHNLGFLSLGDI